MAQVSRPQNSTINFVLMARFHGHVAVEDLRAALDRLKGRHRAFDLPGADRLHHAPSTGPYPLAVLPGCTPKAWESVAAQELARPFDSYGPRARFVLIEHPQADDLLIVCDHHGSDGLSGTYLLRDLLELLNHPGLHLPPLPVPPPVWEVLPDSVTRSVSGRVRSALLPVVLAAMQWAQRWQKPARARPAFQVTSAEFPAEWTAALVECCRVNGTSVHAAVCAAWLSALEPRDAKNRSRRSISSPVSLRKYLAPAMRGCAGMYYTTVVTSLDNRASRHFWEMAREIKRLMVQAENEPAFYSMPLVLRTLFRSMSRLPAGEGFQMPEPRVGYDFSMTNLGRVERPVPQDARYSIDALFGPMVNAFRGEKTVGVCTLGGQLRFVFTTFSSEMDVSAARDILERAVTRLQDAVSFSVP